MTDGKPIEQRLATLFATAELGVVPRPDAAQFLTARVARRRRRRRAARIAAVAGGVLGVGLVTGSLTGVLAGRTDAVTPAGGVVLSSPVPQELPMRAGAVGALRLGMTPAQAQATGLLRGSAESLDAGRTGCRFVDGRRGITRVTIGPRGVEAVEVYPFITTAEGVAVGDRIARARQAYPALRVPADWQLGTVVQVPVPGTTGAHYEITIDVKGDAAGSDPDQALVSRLALVSDAAVCSRA